MRKAPAVGGRRTAAETQTLSWHRLRDPNQIGQKLPRQIPIGQGPWWQGGDGLHTHSQPPTHLPELSLVGAQLAQKMPASRGARSALGH